MNKFASLIELTKGRLREFFREPSAFMFVILLPTLWLVVLELSFRDDPDALAVDGIRVAVVLPQPVANFEQRIADIVVAQFPQAQATSDREEVETLLLRQKLDLIVVPRAPNEVTYSYRQENQNGYTKSLAVRDHIELKLGRKNQTNSRLVIAAEGRTYVDFLVPGLLAMSIFTTSLFGIGMTLVSNRRGNLLKRFLLTPMRPSFYIASHLISRIFILGLEMLCLLSLAWLFYGSSIEGSFSAYSLVALGGALCCSSLAILCGSRLRNTSAYSGAVNLLVIPMMLVAGIFFSRAGFPEWFKTLTDFLPLTALVEGLRKISYEGLGLADIRFELATLAIYTVVCSFLAKRIFKWV